MGKKNPRVDAYIDKAAPFAKPILKHFRKIVHAGCPEVEEAIKWQSPFFVYKGNLCFMAAFKEHCAFGFWKRSLIFGGGSSRDDEAMGHFGRITSTDDLPGEKALIGYVRQAARLNDAGTSVPRSKPKRKPIRVPPFLADALKKNTKARKAFENFSPGDQREYVEWITGAKREETGKRRLKTALAWMAQGKVQNWKYL